MRMVRSTQKANGKTDQHAHRGSSGGNRRSLDNKSPCKRFPQARRLIYGRLRTVVAGAPLVSHRTALSFYGSTRFSEARNGATAQLTSSRSNSTGMRESSDPVMSLSGHARARSGQFRRGALARRSALAHAALGNAWRGTLARRRAGRARTGVWPARQIGRRIASCRVGARRRDWSCFAE